jgi:gliding motility-associated-like protein
MKYSLLIFVSSLLFLVPVTLIFMSSHESDHTGCNHTNHIHHNHTHMNAPPNGGFCGFDSLQSNLSQQEILLQNQLEQQLYGMLQKGYPAFGKALYTIPMVVGLITDTSYSFGIAPEEKVSYLFSAVNEFGCRVDSIVIIDVNKPRRANAPTAFTPNGDGVNDNFFIQGGEKVEEVVVFRVYDRWGELIFEGQNLETNVPEQGWGGNYRGKPCTSGTYTWYADVLFKDDETTQIKGDVILLR